MEETQNNKQRNSASTEPDRFWREIVAGKYEKLGFCWRYLVVRLPRARLFKAWFSGPSGGRSVSVVPDCVKKQNRKQKQRNSAEVAGPV